LELESASTLFKIQKLLIPPPPHQKTTSCGKYLWEIPPWGNSTPGKYLYVKTSPEKYPLWLIGIQSLLTYKKKD